GSVGADPSAVPALLHHPPGPLRRHLGPVRARHAVGRGASHRLAAGHPVPPRARDQAAGHPARGRARVPGGLEGAPQPPREAVRGQAAAHLRKRQWTRPRRRQAARSREQGRPTGRDRLARHRVSRSPRGERSRSPRAILGSTRGGAAARRSAVASAAVEGPAIARRGPPSTAVVWLARLPALRSDQRKRGIFQALMAKLHLITYGCQMNEYDSERVAGLLREERWELTADQTEADLILVNTCAIREKAEDKVFSKLGELRLLKAQK